MMNKKIRAADVHSWEKSKNFSTQIHTHFLNNDLGKQMKIRCIEMGITMTEFVCIAIAEKVAREKAGRA
jgi:hypothetical protein